MSRIGDVLRNKNRVEKINRQRQQEDMANIKKEARFKTALSNDLRNLDVLLDSGEVSSVVMEIPSEHLTKFTRALYSPELADYEITQEDANKFRFRRKILRF